MMLHVYVYDLEVQLKLQVVLTALAHSDLPGDTLSRFSNIKYSLIRQLVQELCDQGIHVLYLRKSKLN